MRISVYRVDAIKQRVELAKLQAHILPYDTPVKYRHVDVWYLAYVGARIAGFAVARRIHTYSNVWYLARAGVIPKYRGLGIQKKLIAARVAAIRKLKGEVIVTDCTLENVASANNLIACGFKLYRPLRTAIRYSTRDVLYWRLKLK